MIFTSAWPTRTNGHDTLLLGYLTRLNETPHHHRWTAQLHQWCISTTSTNGSLAPEDTSPPHENWRPDTSAGSVAPRRHSTGLFGHVTRRRSRVGTHQRRGHRTRWNNACVRPDARLITSAASLPPRIPRASPWLVSLPPKSFPADTLSQRRKRMSKTICSAMKQLAWATTVAPLRVTARGRAACPVRPPSSSLCRVAPRVP